VLELVRADHYRAVAFAGVPHLQSGWAGRCQDPNNVVAMAGLAVLDLGAGDAGAALTRLRRAYDLDRTQPAVLNILAGFMLQKGQYDKVRRAGWSRIGKRSLKTALGAARTAMAGGEPGDECVSLVGGGGSQGRELPACGARAPQQGGPSQACTHVGTLDSRRARMQGKYDDAFGYYFQAAKLNPALVLAQFGLGQLYIHRGA
jgi:tetratricopeptide (TPR) repeat protein